MESSGRQIAPSCWGGSLSESSKSEQESHISHNFSHSEKQIQDDAILIKCAGVVVTALLDGKLFYFFFLHSFSSFGPISFFSVMKLHAEVFWELFPWNENSLHHWVFS